MSYTSVRDLFIARITHEANRAYCEACGDESQPPWEQAPEWQKQSAIQGVVYFRTHPDATPADMHTNWSMEKVKAGWTYGEKKDPVAKTHPCLVPYGELPEYQQYKDKLFSAVVRALL